MESFFVAVEFHSRYSETRNCPLWTITAMKNFYIFALFVFALIAFAIMQICNVLVMQSQFWVVADSVV